MAAEYTSLFGSAPLAQTPSTSTSQITTPPATPLPSNIPFEKYVVDVNGDLHLEIGEAQYLNGGPCKRPIEFRVDSKALSRASPVFMKMLYGSFVESKKPDEPGDRKWTIKLPDDNSLDMSTLICIMHCKFDLVPLAITIDGLYGIAVLTDKYDCTALVRPWIRSWLDTSGAHSSHTNAPTLRRISWIAWEYGDQNLFEKVAKALILYSVTSFPGIFHNSLEPNGLQDLVISRRQAAVDDLLAPLQAALTQLYQPPPQYGNGWLQDEACRMCGCYSNSTDASQCEALLLGKLIRSLVTVGLWPVPSSVTYALSMHLLQADLKSITVNGAAHTKHEDCTPLPNHAASIDAVTDGLTSLTTPSQKRHLEAQAKKSGLRT